MGLHHSRQCGLSMGFFGKLETSDHHSELDGKPDAKKLDFCDERSSVMFYKQNGERKSTALQLLEENLEAATDNDVSERRELNGVQRLSFKQEFIPLGCTENIENKRKTFSRRNVGKFLHLLIMMMDDSTMFQEEQIQNRSMGQLENELCLKCFPHGQSTLVRKFVAEQILENWLKTFLTYVENYSLDVDTIMEAELNELKHFGNVPFKGSKERESIDCTECWTLLMKFVIIGKNTSLNVKIVLEIFCCLM